MLNRWGGARLSQVHEGTRASARRSVTAPPGTERSLGRRGHPRGWYPGLLSSDNLSSSVTVIRKQGRLRFPHRVLERVRRPSSVSHRPHRPRGEGSRAPTPGATAASLRQMGPRHEAAGMESPGSRPNVLPSGPRVSWTHVLPSAPRALGSDTGRSWIRAAFFKPCINLGGSKQHFSNMKNRNWRVSHVLRLRIPSRNLCVRQTHTRM